MGLVSRIRERVDIPHEPGEWVELRPLSGPALEAAREAKVRASIAMMEGYDLDKLRGLNTGPTVQQAIDMYHHAILLERSIVSWSYGDFVALRDLDDLDVRTSNWLVGLILDRNGLLETEAERKNGSGRSIAVLTE